MTLSAPVSDGALGAVPSASPRLVTAPSRETSEWRVGWRTLRAPQWLHFLVLPAVPLYAHLLRDPLDSLARFVPAAVVTALCLGFAYGINAIADRRGDRDAEKNPLAGTERVPLATWVTVLGAAGAALALSAALSERLVPAAAGVSLAASALYSVGPRLKRVPVAGTLANGVIFVPLVFSIRFDWAEAPQVGLLLFTFLALLTEGQLVHEAGDHAEDVSSGVRSSAVAFGRRAVIRAAVVVGVVAAVALVLVWDVSTASVVAAAGVLAGGALVGTDGLVDARRTRRAHRHLSFVAGALLFAILAGEAASPH